MRDLIRVALSLVALAAAMPASAQQMITDPMLPERAAQRVSPHVYVIMGFPNIGIVVGDTGTLVIDTGLGNRNGAVAARTAQALSTKGQKLFLTTTHFHPEHASGQGGFPSNTIVIRNRAQQSELETEGPESLARFSARDAQFKSLLQGAVIGKADMLFDREYDLDLGGAHARLLYYGAAHTRGDELTFVPEDGVLLPGDVVQNKLAPGIVCSSCSPRQWIAVLDQVAPLNPRLIVPDHGALGGRELIAQERKFLSDLEREAQRLKAQGKPAAEAGREIAAEFATRYADWGGLAGVPRSVERAYRDQP